MVCYKFMRAEIANLTLTSLRLKASRPNELNDPFECCPASDRLSIVRKARSDPAKVGCLYQVERDNGFPGSLQDFISEGGLLDQRLIHHLPHGLLASKDLAAREDASKHLGVVCLSRCSLVQLLWSHYADSHRGCALGVEVFHPCFRQARVSDRVLYSREQPKSTGPTSPDSFHASAAAPAGQALRPPIGPGPWRQPPGPSPPVRYLGPPPRPLEASPAPGHNPFPNPALDPGGSLRFREFWSDDWDPLGSGALPGRGFRSRWWNSAHDLCPPRPESGLEHSQHECRA